jgi:hypothetical protein
MAIGRSAVVRIPSGAALMAGTRRDATPSRVQGPATGTTPTRDTGYVVPMGGAGCARTVRGRGGGLLALGVALGVLVLLGPSAAPAAPAVPSVTTVSAVSVEATSAVLQGSVNPNGAQVSACYVEYGLTLAYGLIGSCEKSVGAGSEPVPVSAKVVALQPGATYHFRFVATYPEEIAEGKYEPRFVKGQEQSFVTLPSVTTWTPFVSSLSEPSVNSTFQGYVAVNGSTVTQCHFDYGTSPAVGLSVACGQNVGSTSGLVSSTVAGLQWATTYYVRVVASDAGGTSYGLPQSFQTPNHVSYTPYVPPQFPTIRYPYPTYNSPPIVYPTPKTSAASRISAAVVRCMKLHGRKRARCLAALRSHRGRNSHPASDEGLSVYYCPYGRSSRRSLRAHGASTSEAGWPPKECLKMDKGSAGQHHTIVGMRGVHNWLLGGWGSDTIIGGDRGDVIWGDYQDCCWPNHQTAIIHAGNGRNVIYANDTLNYVWTGTNPKTVVHAHASGISGVIHCQSPAIVLYLSTVSEHHFQLDGCHHISHFSVGY